MLSRGATIYGTSRNASDALMDKNIKSDVVENRGNAGRHFTDVNLQGFAVRLQFRGQ